MTPWTRRFPVRLLKRLALDLVLPAAAAAVLGLTVTGLLGGPAVADSGRDLSVAVSHTDPLSPGGRTTLSVTIGNPNHYPVRITGVSLGRPLSSNPAACRSGTLLLHQRYHAAARTIAAQQNVTIRLPEALSLSGDAAPGCQATSFILPVAATGISRV